MKLWLLIIGTILVYITVSNDAKRFIISIYPELFLTNYSQIKWRHGGRESDKFGGGAAGNGPGQESGRGEERNPEKGKNGKKGGT